jgi:hypothetical protein
LPGWPPWSSHFSSNYDTWRRNTDMTFKNLDVGYDPRPNPFVAIWTGTTAFLSAAVLTMIGCFVLTPIHPDGAALDLIETWSAIGTVAADRQIILRLVLGVGVGALGGLVAFRYACRNMPLTEPFQQITERHPRVSYGEYAREDLKRRLFAEAGQGAPNGLYLAPHLAMPRSCETKNILVVGEPNSGKSNITRALADQAIDRGDRVLLLCNKGDVTSAFTSDEAVLIAAHHQDSYALDLAADIVDVAAAAQFAADVVPASNPPFWSDCARTVLTDIILKLQEARPGRWTARMLLNAALRDSEVIRRSIANIALNASPLLQGADGGAEDKTVTGILMTMRSAAFANLRPLAWAWDQAPPERRFSVRRWMSDGYAGPRTVIVQYSSDYEALSTLIAGSLIRRVAKRLADPQLAVDPTRRVVMVLDEFHLLDKIEGLSSALAVGREKGLVVILGIQNYGQLIEKYGENGANTLLDLFRIKIFGRLSPGTSANLVAKHLGERDVSTLVENRTPGKDDPRRFVEERKLIPTFSATQLASELGVFDNGRKTGDVLAIVQCYGQSYVLEWPFTIWGSKRAGFIPARWLTQPPITS